MITPVEVLLTIRIGLEALLETMKWLQTAEGKTFSAQVTKDRAAWDKFWKDAGDGIKKFFSGELFK